MQYYIRCTHFEGIQNINERGTGERSSKFGYFGISDKLRKISGISKLLNFEMAKRWRIPNLRLSSVYVLLTKACRKNTKYYWGSNFLYHTLMVIFYCSFNGPSNKILVFNLFYGDAHISFNIRVIISYLLRTRWDNKDNTLYRNTGLIKEVVILSYILSYMVILS